MYEFKELLQENIMETMTTNWLNVCTKIKVDFPCEPTFSDEKHILDLILKNIIIPQKASHIAVHFC